MGLRSSNMYDRSVRYKRTALVITVITVIGGLMGCGQGTDVENQPRRVVISEQPLAAAPSGPQYSASAPGATNPESPGGGSDAPKGFPEGAMPARHAPVPDDILVMEMQEHDALMSQSQANSPSPSASDSDQAQYMPQSQGQSQVDPDAVQP